MAQAQAVRTSTKELTQTQSVALIKNLVRASISEVCTDSFTIVLSPINLSLNSLQVCFIRNLFPSDLFKSTAFGSTTVRVLCPKDTGMSNQIANLFSYRPDSVAIIRTEAILHK